MIDLTTSASENPRLTPSNPGIARLRDLYFFDLNEDDEDDDAIRHREFVFFTIITLGKDRLRRLS